METNVNTPAPAPQPTKPHNAAANALMVVAFLVLIFIGIAIAIYSSRYVPMAINTFSTENGVTGLPSNPNQNAVAVTPGTSIPFGTQQMATSTVMTTSSFPTTGPGYSTLPNGYQTLAQQNVPTSQTASAYEAPRAPYGLADLNVQIIAVGYLANSSNASFVATPVIPVGARAAVEFSIGNTGTNVTGPWAFTAQIPTDNGYTFNSPVEPSLNPGDHTVFTLAFDQVPTGPAEQITIIADPRNYIQEITKNNNVAETSVAVVGS